MSHNRILRSAVAVAVIAGTALTTAYAADAHDGRHRVVATFTATIPATVTDATTCDPSGRCLVSYTIPAGEMAGDVRGTIDTHGVIYLDPSTFTYTGSSYQLFTGHVDGCGDGTLVTFLPAFSGGITGPVATEGSVVRGSGTGDFSGVSGKVRSVLETLPDGTGIATGRLELRC